jgi:hypothetical protein
MAPAVPSHSRTELDERSEGLIFPQDKRPTFEVFGDLADLGLESIELWSIHSIWP